MEQFTITPKKKAILDYVLGYLFLALGILAIVLTMAFGSMIPLTAAIVFIVLWVIFVFRRNYEYELAYFDGDFKVVRIANKARRKLKLKFTLDEVVQIAPVGDRSVYKYENDRMAKHYDFSSHAEGTNPYVIVMRSGEVTSVMIVEPDEKMLDAICRKGVQKVIRKKES